MPSTSLPRWGVGRSPHARAVLQALFVTFLWSTSWVLIKIGLKELPALTFAGLRYALAFACLAPFAFRSGRGASLRSLSPAGWGGLLALGVVYYAITQGAQYLALQYLPAATVSLLLSFTVVLVAFLGIFLLGEKPSAAQWLGGGLYLVGVLVYFYPAELPASQVIGLVIAGVGVLANALSSILGRSINRSQTLDPLSVTAVSMGAGATLLLASGLAVQGAPRLSLGNWAIVLWLAVVNSALAFTLWNRTLRTLTAMESSVINNTMLFQIAVLAWVFLGEALSWRQVLGMLVAAAGAVLVQLRR
ncbi:MAG: DMT family transporter [Anaerolineales bacterium]|nr:DMT family transporter [Anaerolineales bacterium]